MRAHESPEGVKCLVTLWHHNTCIAKWEAKPAPVVAREPGNYDCGLNLPYFALPRALIPEQGMTRTS